MAKDVKVELRRKARVRRTPASALMGVRAYRSSAHRSRSMRKLLMMKKGNDCFSLFNRER